MKRLFTITSILVMSVMSGMMCSSCGQDDHGQSAGTHDTLNKHMPGSDSCTFSDPDTSLGSVRLRDIASMKALLGPKENYHGDQVIQFYSHDRKQQVLFAVHKGSKDNEVSEIDVLPADQYARQSHRVLPMNGFVTEKGIRFGISKAAVIAKLGTCYTAKSTNGDVRLLYEINVAHDSKTGLLHRHGVTDYYAGYRFRHDSLYLFEFGFRDPAYKQRLQWEKANGLNQ